MGLYNSLIEDKYHTAPRNREKEAEGVCLCLMEGQETFQEVSPKPRQKEDTEKEGEK